MNTRLGQYTKIINDEEVQLNESILTLLSRQKDLQKQSLDMIQNMIR